MLRRRAIRDVVHALEEASSWAAWSEAARAHDALTGADAWRADDDCDLYDADGIKQTLARWAALRDAGQAVALADAVSHDLQRHLVDISDPDLYAVALSGTKHLVERLLDEAERAFRWLAATPVPGVSTADKIRRFEAAWAVHGHTALLLSGGATWGFHHLGVVKALFEQGLLPHILSGASTGAMIAAGVCTRDDAELADMFADLDALRLDGLRPVGLLRAARTGAMLDPAQLFAVLRHNVGERTFAQAHAHSGRALNISVSPTRRRQKPRLLNHLTAPDVLVASAALASSALPALFPPVELMARVDGVERPWLAGERWVDGTLHGDLPKRRLARLHNVNHFVVSQTNPHVLPFLRFHGRRGLRPALYAVALTTARAQGGFAVDLARRAGRRTPLEPLFEGAYALLSQEYRGDIDVHPRFRWRLYQKVVANPSREDLAAFVREGERAVWLKLAMIRDQTRLGRTFRDCVASLRAEGAETAAAG